MGRALVCAFDKKQRVCPGVRKGSELIFSYYVVVSSVKKGGDANELGDVGVGRWQSFRLCGG